MSIRSLLRSFAGYTSYICDLCESEILIQRTWKMLVVDELYYQHYVSVHQ